MIRDADWSLPGWLYTDAEFAGVETARVIRPSWQIVCHESDLADPGDYRTPDYLGESVAAVRGDDRQVRAFINVRRHLLHHVFGEVNGKYGAWGYSVGGMGAITQGDGGGVRRTGRGDQPRPARRAGAGRWGKVAGVRLESGEEIAARIVAANVGPLLLYRQLIDAGDLDATFRRRIAGFKAGSGSFRMNVASSELPEFSVLPGKGLAEHHTAGIIIAPGLDYMDRAHDDARAWLIEEADRRGEAAHRGRRHARAAGHAHREPAPPAVRARAAGRTQLGRRARGGRRT